MNIKYIFPLLIVYILIGVILDNLYTYTYIHKLQTLETRFNSYEILSF